MLSILLVDQGCTAIREKLKLDKDAVVLMFNTEGNTNPVNYRDILWNGRYPMPVK